MISGRGLIAEQTEGFRAKGLKGESVMIQKKGMEIFHFVSVSVPFLFLVSVP